MERYGAPHSKAPLQPKMNDATVSTSDVQAEETTPLLPRAREKYSNFSTGQKMFIIFTAALASTFSPLSSNIYYPAINSIAEDLKVTASMMNLTITAYMVFQGLAPSFMGNLSDTAGRRPVYVLCFGVYLAANVGLAIQRNFWALLALRALQSTGISATVALSNAVAADTVTSAERGTYLGIASLGSILGPALGPTLGGVISEYWGWYGIFWVLAAVSGMFFLLLALFYPETCRQIVGNGSVPPPPWNQSLLNVLSERRKRREGVSLKEAYARRSELAEKRKIRFPNPLLTLRLLFELPMGLILFSNGIAYGAYYAVTSSVPMQFAEIYGLNDFELGLTYIPIGLGTILSSFTNGFAVDWNFKRFARLNGGLPPIKNGRQDLTGFPVEQARLQIAIPMAVTAALSIAAYGWVLHFEAPLWLALTFLFLIGYFMTASYNVMNVLIVDLKYDTPATATAANNLVRCFIGAAATAGIIPLLETLGRGPSFAIVAAIWTGITPLTLLVYWRGMQWRQDKLAADEDREEPV